MWRTAEFEKKRLDIGLGAPAPWFRVARPDGFVQMETIRLLGANMADFEEFR
jgi:hypothetical protein